MSKPTEPELWSRPGLEVLATLPEGESCKRLWVEGGTLYADTTCGLFKLARGRLVLSNDTGA